VSRRYRVKTKTLHPPGFSGKRDPTRAREIDKLHDYGPKTGPNGGIPVALRLRKAEFTLIG